MRWIDNPDQLLRVLNDNNGIVLYGAGEYTRLLLRYLDYIGLKKRILCLAVKNRYENEEIIQDVPVFTLDELSLFFKQSIWIVCVKKHFITCIDDDLQNKGIDSVMFISENGMDAVRRLFSEADSNMILCNHMDYLEKELWNIKWEIEEQAEICEVNSKAFEIYRNAYRGKDLAVVATGPTLKEYQFQEELIHIGVNFAPLRKDIKFDFLFLQELGDGRFDYERTQRIYSSVKDAKIMLGKFSRRDPSYRNGIPEEFLESISNVERYYVSTSSTTEPIRQDICRYPLTDCFSAVFPAIHFALFTYPRKLYLIGCDVSGGNHFYADDEGEKGNWLVETADRLKLGYIKMKRFAELYYPETEIISINPVGLKGLFQDEYK